MINTVKITDANVIEQVRSGLPSATAEIKGLLNSDLYLRILGEYVHGISTSASDDLNEIYKRYNAGMAVLILTSVTKNAPGAGVLLHFQRLNKNDISAGSFLVSQVCFLMNGNILYRIGSSNGNAVFYSNWSNII